jgi:hypothetical protein
MYSKLLSFWLGLMVCTSLFGATYDFSYSGRLIDSTGKPYDGPVALKASFYHAGELVAMLI